MKEFYEKFKKFIIPIIIVIIVLNVGFAIFNMKMWKMIFFTILQIACVIVPIFLAVIDKRISVFYKWPVILVSAIILFTFGVFGFFDIISPFSKIICPYGFDNIRAFTKTYTYSQPGEISVSINILYECFGALGSYKPASLFVFFICSFFYFLYSFSVQLISLGCSKIPVLLNIKHKIRSKRIRIISTGLFSIVFIVVVFLTCKYDNFLIPKITKSMNKLLYPGQHISLIEATRRGRFDIVKELVEDGGNIHKKNKTGESAIIVAEKLNNTEILNYYKSIIKKESPYKSELVEMGIVFTKENFIIQIRKKNYDAVKLFLDGKIQVKPDKASDYNPLGTAILINAPDIVKLLIEHGAKVNIKTPYMKDNYLNMSCEGGNIEIVKLLIENGAVINFQNYKGETALMKASEYGHLEIVQYLINKKAKINLMDELGRTAFLYAAEYMYMKKPGTKDPYIDIIKLLIHHGANPDIQDSSGWTALMHACKYGNYEIAEYLIDLGVNLDANEIKSGDTSLKIAKKYGYYKIVKLLNKKEARE